MARTIELGFNDPVTARELPPPKPKVVEKFQNSYTI